MKAKVLFAQVPDVIIRPRSNKKSDTLPLARSTQNVRHANGEFGACGSRLVFDRLAAG
jgi:hypothetical protein